VALSPRELLQHMELPPKGKGHPWPGATGAFVLGSLEPVRISLYCQQVRAVNLVYALVCENRLREGCRIAIIGAGPAGLTVARAASQVGATCTVFEKAERPMRVFCPGGEGNSRRFVHPSVENWPFYGSNDMSTSRLPVMRWEAGTPRSVADRLMADLKNRKGISVHVNVTASIKHRGDVWKVDFASQRWFLDGWPKPELDRIERDSKEFDLLVLAIGFGNDQATSEAPAYWQDDQHLWRQICKHNGSVLISGDGDGALIDAVSAVAATEANLQSHQQQLISTVLKEVPNYERLRDGLIDIETRLHQSSLEPSKLKQLYEELGERAATELGSFDALILPRQKQRQVTLLTPGIWPMKARTFAINRFLLWRFLKHDFVEHRSGRVVKLAPSPTSGKIDQPVTISTAWPVPDQVDETAIANRSEIKADWCIHRHGTKKPLESDYPKLHALCKRLLQPKNELDQTRIPAWPDNFFGSDWTHANEESERTPQKRAFIIKVPRPRAVAKFNSITCLDEFKPYENGSGHSPNRWIRSDTIIKFNVDNVPKGFSLEHRLTPTSPLRLMFFSPKDPRIKSRRLAGAPPWAVAYVFEEEVKNETIELVLVGSPTTAYSFADSAGFPVFGDMAVTELRWHVVFRSMRPQILLHQKSHVLLDATMLAYQEPIRRLGYEDGTDDQHQSEPLNDPPVLTNQHIRLARDGDSWQTEVSWEAKDKRPLPTGYFYGAQWHRIVAIRTKVSGTRPW
jgi:hypothetical protein